MVCNVGIRGLLCEPMEGLEARWKATLGRARVLTVDKVSTPAISSTSHDEGMGA